MASKRSGVSLDKDTEKMEKQPMATPSTLTVKTTLSKSAANWRDRTAMVLMLLATAGAFVSFLSGIGDSLSASPATQVVEIWRSYGFGIFSGLFLLLALFPRRYPGIWELAILNKAALALTGLIVLAYLLARGYSGWATFKTARTTEDMIQKAKSEH